MRCPIHRLHWLLLACSLPADAEAPGQPAELQSVHPHSPHLPEVGGLLPLTRLARSAQASMKAAGWSAARKPVQHAALVLARLGRWAASRVWNLSVLVWNFGVTSVF